MTDPRPLSDEELIAYFEGALFPEAAASVEARLASDPQAQAKLADWAQQNTDLRALFSAPDSTPIPSRLTDTLRAAPERPPYLRVAAIAGLLLIGAAGGWLGHAARHPTPATLTLAQAAITAHDTYVVEVVHPVEVPATQRAHMDAWMSKRMGTKMQPPDLSAAGFSLMGGRILPSSDSPAGLYMYENADGLRITLYVAHQPGNDSAFQFAGQDSTQSLQWSDNGLGYALTGPLPREQLKDMAKTAYDQLL